MNDRAVSLFEKYDVTVEKTRKGRGAIIAETPQGMIALTEYFGPVGHLGMEHALLMQIGERFQGPLDTIIETKEGELYCTDYDSKKYIVKKYVEGRELNVGEESECLMAMGRLASLHRAMQDIELYVEKPLPVLAEDAGTGTKLESVDEALTDPQQETEQDSKKPLREKILFETKQDNLLADFDRRCAELVRARNYMRRVSHRDDFELAFLGCYDRFMEQADMAYSFLNPEVTTTLTTKQKQKKMFIHGDCTHHNIVLQPDGMTFVGFEKAGAHLQMKDVYLFMRKVLEKNNWSYPLAFQMLEAYQKELPLQKEELTYLYARFLFPEKYWKVANGYLNRRKALPARRQQEKLSSFVQKEEKRQLFLNKWLETCR